MRNRQDCCERLITTGCQEKPVYEGQVAAQALDFLRREKNKNRG
jgi:hypothetical protein